MKRDLYLSSFTSEDNADLTVRAASYDDLGLDVHPSLINVCAEGSELAVLKGMGRCLNVWRPVIVVENRSLETSQWLKEEGYEVSFITGSPSILATGLGRTAS